MRIVIDPQGMLGGSRTRGIGRYTRSFLRAFAHEARAHEIFIVLNTMLPANFDILRDDLEGIVPPQNFVTWSAEPVIGGMYPDNNQRRALAKDIWEELVNSLEPDLLIISSLFEGAEDDAVCSVPTGRDYPVATICYDLIPLIYNQHYLLHPGMRAHYRRVVDMLASSDFLLAISQSAADEAVQLLRYPIERVVNVSAAVDSTFGNVPPLGLEERFGITRPYLLYVSAFELRKNHAGLVRAYASQSADVRAGHQLVLGGGVGNAEQLRDIGREQGLRDDELIFTGNVNDDELGALYGQAKAVAFPSWHEGFGLPILEAMMFGKAVISSNRSSMPEVVGCEEALFDPFDETAMAAAVERVLTDEAFRLRLEANAPKRVATFTWERSAKIALAFLEEGVARYPRPRDYQRRFVANAVGRVRGNPALRGFPPDVASRHIARTFRRDERRQLLIDVSRLVVEDARTGIQRVVRAILLSLLKNPPAGWVVQPVHANATDLGYRYAREFADRFLGVEHPWHTDGPVEVWSGDTFCVLDLEPDVLIKQRPVLDDWRLRGVQVYTVVHDILPLLLPDYFPDSVGQKVISQWVRELARHDGAICVSRTVADQLAHWMKENEVELSSRFRIGWFHHGSDLNNTAPTKGLPQSATDVLATLNTKPAALMVGTLEPRKGHAQAIDAFDILWKQGIDIALVIVGKKGWRIDELSQRIKSHPEYRNRLIWLENISDEYLERVYESASFLLAASVGEGFGLPLIEAARKNLPLVVRDIPVFREVAGDAAYFFKNRADPRVIADGIKAWLKLHRTGRHPMPSGVQKLSWDESARMLVEQLIGTANFKL